MIKQYLYILMSISMLASPVLPSASPNQKAHVLDVVTRIVGIRNLILNYYAGYRPEQEQIRINMKENSPQMQQLIALFGDNALKNFLAKLLVRPNSLFLFSALLETSLETSSPNSQCTAFYDKDHKQIVLQQKLFLSTKKSYIPLAEIIDEKHSDPVIAFSHDNKQLAISFLHESKNSSIYIFDITQKKLIKTLTMPADCFKPKQLSQIMYSPNNAYIALCTGARIYIFTIATGREYEIFGESFLFSPDGRYLVARRWKENEHLALSLYKEDRVEDLDEPKPADSQEVLKNLVPNFMQHIIKKIW